NPYPDGLPDSVQQALAQDYENLFRLFLTYRDNVSRVTFWGAHDGQTWLNNWPIRSRTNYPLLFDRNLAPKTAFYPVIATKSNEYQANYWEKSPTFLYICNNLNVALTRMTNRKGK